MLHFKKRKDSYTLKWHSVYIYSLIGQREHHGSRSTLFVKCCVIERFKKGWVCKMPGLISAVCMALNYWKSRTSRTCQHIRDELMLSTTIGSYAFHSRFTKESNAVLFWNRCLDTSRVLLPGLLAFLPPRNCSGNIIDIKPTPRKLVRPYNVMFPCSRGSSLHKPHHFKVPRKLLLGGLTGSGYNFPPLSCVQNWRKTP